MSSTKTSPFYISRQQAEEFLSAFAQALKQPQEHPLVFQVWGIGGVGKTTLLDELEKQHSKAIRSRAYFGRTAEIETPLKLMATLYASVSTGDGWGDSFTDLYEQYQQTLQQLETQPVEGKATVDTEQLNLVKRLVNFGIAIFSELTPAPRMATTGLEKAGEAAVDLATLALSEKDRIQQLLQQHRATKRNQKLQTLMLEPLPILTRAFLDGLKQTAKHRPVIVLLDTYEKASTDVDDWLRRYILDDRGLQSSALRVVIAGRRNVEEKEGWRKLQQDRQLIFERQLREFSQDEATEYLQKIGLTQPAEIEQIYQATRGLPYYLNWMRREREAGRPIDFSRGNQAIADLLLQGLDAKQHRIIQLAACCRWFDRLLMQQLLTHPSLELQLTVEQARDCFNWLTQCDFVEYAQSGYRLDDVARDVFRRSLFQDDRGATFRQVCGLLADYFEAQAHQDLAPDSPMPALYQNSEWRQYTSEAVYYALFARRPDLQRQFLTRLFESRYLDQPGVVKNPLRAIAAEADLATHPQLSPETRTFLTTLRPAVDYSLTVLVEKQVDDDYIQRELNLLGSQVEAILTLCFSKIDVLPGLAKFAALLHRSRCCPAEKSLAYLAQAKDLALQLTLESDAEFSSSLYSVEGLGKVLFELGHYKEALASYDKALDIKPDRHDAWNSRGVVLGELGHYREAIANYDKALDIKSDKHEAWYNKGISLFALGEKEAALASYDQAIKIKPDLYEAWYNRGITLYSLERNEVALASYDQAIAIKADDHRVWNNRGIVLSDLGCNQEALESYSQAILVKSDDYFAWSNRGKVLSELGCHEEAVTSCDKAISIKSDYQGAWYNRGIALANLGKKELAIASYDKALELKPDFYEVWYNRGISLMALKREKEAIASYEQAIKCKPDFYEAWYNRGIALYKLGCSDDAIASYDKALEIKPNLHEAWTNRGVALSNIGNKEGALKSFDRSLELELINHQAWNNLAHILCDLGYKAEAIGYYDTALKIKPTYYEAWNNQGIALHDLGRIESAIASYDKALDLKPDYHEAWSNRGVALSDLGRQEEAIASYDKALKLKPDLHEAWYKKACCCGLQGHVEQAIEHLQRAIELNGDRYRELAKTDSDFDRIRDDERFQSLLVA